LILDAFVTAQLRGGAANDDAEQTTVIVNKGSNQWDFHGRCLERHSRVRSTIFELVFRGRPSQDVFPLSDSLREADHLCLLITYRP